MVNIWLVSKAYGCPCWTGLDCCIKVAIRALVTRLQRYERAATVLLCPIELFNLGRVLRFSGKKKKKKPKTSRGNANTKI